MSLADWYKLDRLGFARQVYHGAKVCFSSPLAPRGALGRSSPAFFRRKDALAALRSAEPYPSAQGMLPGLSTPPVVEGKKYAKAPSD